MDEQWLLSGRGIIRTSFVEWEVMLVKVFRKQTFCRASYILARLMGSNAWVKSTVPLMLLFSASAIGRLEEYQVSSVMASQEPHWLSSKTWLPLIRMSSSWKMTQVNALLELCTSNLAPDCLSLHMPPCFGWGHNYYLFEIGMIKGCHPCLSSWPPCLWTVEEIASLQGSVPSEWAEGENVSSKNQKRPHGFKYFQVARN